jgi:hypothetical protein
MRELVNFIGVLILIVLASTVAVLIGLAIYAWTH